MKRNKTIVVLGGSYLQSGFIRNAATVLDKVFVLDGNSHCYAAQNGLGEFCNLNFSNLADTRTFCIEKGVDAVLAPVNEFGNLIAAEISKDLGFKYNSPEVVRMTSDKALFAKMLEKNEFRATKSFDFKKPDEIKFPVIVKPTQSTSSKGVSLVTRSEQLEEAINYAASMSKTGEIRVEEFIEGDQLSVETISNNGRHLIVGVVEEHLSEAPYFFERSDLIDKERSIKYIEMLNPFVQQLLDLFQIQTGPCHIEVRIRNEEIFVIDIASRSGGWRDILLLLSGINYNQIILDSYLDNFSLRELPNPSYSSGAGIMLYYEDMLQLKKAIESGLVEESFLNGNLPNLSPKTLADAYGYYFVRGNTRKEITRLLPKLIE